MLSLVLLGMAKARANLKQRLGLCQKTDRLTQRERGTYRDAGVPCPAGLNAQRTPKGKEEEMHVPRTRRTDHMHQGYALWYRVDSAPCRTVRSLIPFSPPNPSTSHQDGYGRGVSESFVCVLLFVSTVANQSVICCVLSSHAETDLASSTLHQPEHICHRQRLIKKPQRPSIT